MGRLPPDARDAGQVQTATLADYLVPSGCELPALVQSTFSTELWRADRTMASSTDMPCSTSASGTG
jgi:hypothetical protein